MAPPRSGPLDLSAVGRLPLRVRRGRFETAVSLLNRLALRNGCEGTNRLLQRVPGLPPRGRYTMPQLAAIAARVNGCGAEALAASSVARLGATFELGGVPVLSGRRAVQGRVCIGCLREDLERASELTRPWAPFLRDWWQVAQVGACPLHRIALVGTCHGCGQPLDMRRPSAARCPCGADLLATDPGRLPAAHVAADAYLLGRLGRGPTVRVPTLDALGFGSAAGLMLNVGVSLDARVPFNRTWDPGPDRARHASCGLEALSDGWAGYDEALGAIRAISSADRRTYRLVGRYGRLQHWLGHEPAEDLEPFRARLVEHARTHGAVTQSTTIFGARVTDGEWTTMDDARRIVGRHAGPIHRVLVALGLGDRATGPARDDLVATDAVQRVKEAFEGLADSAEVRAALGCDKSQLARYVAASVLEEFCSGGRTTTAYFRRRDLDRLVDATMGGLPSVRELPSGMLTLGRANADAGLGSEAVTLAVVAARVRPLAVLVGADGVPSLRNVLVRRSDVARLRREAGRGYTVAEAAPLLRLHRFTLGKLRPLLALSRPDGRMTAEDVREVRRRFATLREIAAAHPGLGRRAEILERLGRDGVRPVLEGEWVEPLFERDEVVAVLGAVPEEALPEELLGGRQGSR